MTRTELDNFLKPLSLTWEWTNQPVDSAAGFEIGEGWYDSVKGLITDLLALGWNGKLYQVKEKFGGGRFYIGRGNKEIFARIGEWESRTFEICEQCGTMENVYVGGDHWTRTLCTKCRPIDLVKE